MTFRRCIHRLLVIAMAIGSFGITRAAVAEQPDYYYFFKERKPLTLDPSRIVVRRASDGVVAAAVPDLSQYGIDNATVKAHTVPRLAWASTPADKANRQGVTALVKEVAQDKSLDFVSPVFLDERNLPTIVTRDLIVRFRDGVTRDEAIDILAHLAPGEILDIDYAHMKNVYRIRSASRNGFDVLTAANALAVRPDVAFAEPDILWTAVLEFTPDDPRFPSQWGLRNVGQMGGTFNMDMDGPQAWDISTGSDSIIVAILDDGVDQGHADINQIAGIDATGNSTGGNPLNMCDNHGTAVAGCVSAIINNATGGTGIAPGVKIVSTKFAIETVPCDGTGNVQSTWVINALDVAESMGVRVTNTSWSIGPGSSVSAKFAATRANGMIHFAAAGNSSSNIAVFPASDPMVNSISALARTGNLASFSNFGPTIAFTAPGESIWTTDRTGPAGYTATDEAEVSGTSFASPYSAGVAAMVLSVDSSKTPDEVEQIMQATAMDLGDPGWDEFFGFGLVKAAAAMELASPSNTTCDTAVVALCNSSRTFLDANVDNPVSPAFSCGDGTAHDGALWYSFVATDTSAHVSMCNSAGGDSTFAVYSGTCGQLTEIACSETSSCGSPQLADACVAGLTIGETYYIQVAARTPADRGLYHLDIGCSCLGACCSLPPLDPCVELRERECADIGGSFGGPATACVGDADGDGQDDGCEVLESQFFQLPAPAQELIASNLDAADFSPAPVIADDFAADGRSIKGVRWWGGSLDAGVAPDGWLIGFHEPLADGGPAAVALGLYYCDSSVVQVTSTGVDSCVGATILQYDAALSDCCLIHTTVDSRNGATPANAFSFTDESCLDYHLSVQAVVGRRYVDDGFGGCMEEITGTSVTADYWGWQTTTIESSVAGALSGVTSTAASDWLFGPWTPVTAACGAPNMAFELLTSENPGVPEEVSWWNGIPDRQNALNSQFGGELTDFITVDDFELSATTSINRVRWTTEDAPQFEWSGRVRLEIYPDNGALAPDGSGGPTVAMWIPDDGGTVTRTTQAQGMFFPRRDYDVRGLSLVLPPGVWWIGLASAANTGTSGQSLWPTSHTIPPDNPFFYGGEAHLRAPSVGFPTFTPWDDLVAGPSQYDVNFSLSFAGVADCNCNGVDDAQDISLATSSDCNTNLIPDECERDCNANGVPDDCDVVAGTSEDCQSNGIPDECDVFLGVVADANGNQIPDVCECNAAPVTLGPETDDKNRFISFVPGNAGVPVAIRVRLTNVAGYGSFNNEVRWVGPPQSCSECATGSFTVAELQCAPHFADWGSISLLDVVGAAVVPGSTYEVQVLPQSCAADLSVESNYTSAVTVTTAKWGDVTLPWGGGTQPNFSDVSAVVSCFSCTSNAPRKAYCLLQPSVPNACGNVTFADISQDVGAFSGGGFGFAGPTTCP